MKINNHRQIILLLVALQAFAALLFVYLFFHSENYLPVFISFYIFLLMVSGLSVCVKFPPYTYNYEINGERLLGNSFLRKSVFDEPISEITAVELVTDCFMIVSIGSSRIELVTTRSESGNLLRIHAYLLERMTDKRQEKGPNKDA